MIKRSGAIGLFQLAVTDGDGAVIVNESEHLDSGVGQSYGFTVETNGRHEVSVVGDDWRGQLAWSADTCAQFDATIRITDDRFALWLVVVLGWWIDSHRGVPSKTD